MKRTEEKQRKKPRNANMNITGQPDIDNLILKLIPSYKHQILRLVCKDWYNVFRNTPRVSPCKCISECAFYGELQLIQWLRENGCPWNEDTYSSATKGGHLKIIKWLREN